MNSHGIQPIPPLLVSIGAPVSLPFIDACPVLIFIGSGTGGSWWGERGENFWLEEPLASWYSDFVCWLSGEFRRCGGGKHLQWYGCVCLWARQLSKHPQMALMLTKITPPRPGACGAEDVFDDRIASWKGGQGGCCVG